MFQLAPKLQMRTMASTLALSFAEKLLVCNAPGTGRLVRASRHIKSRLEIQTLTPADSRHSREQEYGKLLQQQRRQATGNKKQQETSEQQARMNKDERISQKLPLTVEDANVSNVERKVTPVIFDKLTSQGRSGEPSGDPLLDASSFGKINEGIHIEAKAGEESPKVLPPTQESPIITDKFTVLGLLGETGHDEYPLLLEASKEQHKDFPEGLGRKLPLTVEDTHMIDVTHRLPNNDKSPVLGVGQVSDDPIFQVSLAQHAEIVSNMDRRVPTATNESPVQGRGEPVDDPLLDTTLEQEVSHDSTTADEGTGVHLDVRPNFKWTRM
jgi:hypothetical protein